ncbi:MAG: LPS export ABC transporter periplasmic protein LptC [Candidatus Cloacimonetes bacterium HGW-Cloacimonetes-2]|nr:MAG: LPS export ABC transporter periplasmic protein LptC [Candidatus Cloacimonetes bacterium HGW-Cloacimonetes-2]
MRRLLKPICRKFPSLLLLVLILSSFSCGEKMELDRNTPVMDRELPDETSHNVRITELDGNRVDYILEAEKIERFYDRRILNGWKVLITSYDKAGNIQSTIKADTTIVDDARNVIFASGNVYVTSPNGSIQTRKITWDRNMDEIVAPEAVTLKRQGSVLKGKNLRTNSTISFAELAEVQAEGIFQDEEIIDW